MASRVWLLIEWIDERNEFPSYGVLDVDTLAGNETNLQPGNLIFTRMKHGNPKRAKILQISESKRYIKEQRTILERQHQPVTNVLQVQLCVRPVEEMQSGNSFIALEQTGSHSPLPHVVVAPNDNNKSANNSEHNVKIERSTTSNSNKPTIKNNRKKSIGKHARGSLNTKNVRQLSIIRTSSISLPRCVDKGTQTEKVCFKCQANLNSNVSTSMSESERNENVPPSTATPTSDESHSPLN